MTLNPRPTGSERGKVAGTNAAQLEVLRGRPLRAFHLVGRGIADGGEGQARELDKLRRARWRSSSYRFAATKTSVASSSGCNRQGRFIRSSRRRRRLTVLAMVRPTRRAGQGECSRHLHGRTRNASKPDFGAALREHPLRLGHEQELRQAEFSAHPARSLPRRPARPGNQVLAWPVVGKPIRSRLPCSMRRFGRGGRSSSMCRCEGLGIRDCTAALIREDAAGRTGRDFITVQTREMLKHPGRPVRCQKDWRHQRDHPLARCALCNFNTDVAAVVRPLEKRLARKAQQILVIGAGVQHRQRSLVCRRRARRVTAEQAITPTREAHRKAKAEQSSGNR